MRLDYFAFSVEYGYTRVGGEDFKGGIGAAAIDDDDMLSPV